MNLFCCATMNQVCCSRKDYSGIASSTNIIRTPPTLLAFELL
jgi:hypothetical protein